MVRAHFDKGETQLSEETQNGTPEAAPSQINIFDRAMCLNLEIGRFGTRKKVRSSQIQTDADRTLVHVSKDILDAPEFKAVARFDGETRDYIWRKSLPSQFRNGISLIPFEDVTPVDDYLTGRETERAQLVAAAMARVDEIKQEAETRLASLFNHGDYPPESVMLQAYSMRWNFFEYGTPGKLKSISVKLYEREREKAKANAVNEVEQIRLALRAGAAEIVNHMVDRLTPEADGKKKVFRDSLIDNVREFLDDFEHKNIVNDDALAALVKQAKDIMEGITAKDLRSDDGFRDFTREQFSNIKTALDDMLKDAPQRKFHLRSRMAPEDTGDSATSDAEDLTVSQ